MSEYEKLACALLLSLPAIIIGATIIWLVWKAKPK